MSGSRLSRNFNAENVEFIFLFLIIYDVLLTFQSNQMTDFTKNGHIGNNVKTKTFLINMSEFLLSVELTKEFFFFF